MTSMPLPSIYHRPRWQLILIFFILVVVISSVGFFYYEVQKKDIRKDKQDELLAIADLKVSQIENWRNERLSDAATIRANFLLAHEIQRFLHGSKEIEERRDILSWMESFKETYQYADILLLDKKETILLSVEDTSKVIGSKTKKLVSEALRTRKIIFSDLYRSEVSDKIHLSIIVPILSEDQHDTLGVILLRVDPYLFLFPFIEKWPTHSPTAETMLVRREGDEVVYMNDLRHRKGTALTLRLPISGHQLPAAMAVTGKEGLVEGIDYRGTQVLAALRSIPDSSWAIVSKVDKEEVYAPIRERLWNVMLVIGLCILSAGAGVIIFWRKTEEKEQSKYRKELEDTVKRRTEELDQTYKQLKESYKDLESFSYSVSHDLRQPLIVVEWIARNLLKKSGDKLDAKEQEKLSVICEQAVKMTQLIKDLLSFSRASSKEVRKSDIDMNMLLHSVTEEMKIMIGERSVEINVKDLPVAWGDESLIRQVLVNLLSNAIKYTRPKNIARIEIGGAEKEDGNIYFIKDNGVGFDSKDTDKLFSPFKRLHSSEEFEGTGIGLVIMKKIINKHSGQVWAEGNVNGGATFYFTLPKKEII
jgi:signal transduction histidine kinase